MSIYGFKYGRQVKAYVVDVDSALSMVEMTVDVGLNMSSLEMLPIIVDAVVASLIILAIVANIEVVTWYSTALDVSVAILSTTVDKESRFAVVVSGVSFDAVVLLISLFVMAALSFTVEVGVSLKLFVVVAEASCSDKLSFVAICSSEKDWVVCSSSDVTVVLFAGKAVLIISLLVCWSDTVVDVTYSSLNNSASIAVVLVCTCKTMVVVFCTSDVTVGSSVLEEVVSFFDLGFSFAVVISAIFELTVVTSFAFDSFSGFIVNVATFYFVVISS